MITTSEIVAQVVLDTLELAARFMSRPTAAEPVMLTARPSGGFSNPSRTSWSRSIAIRVCLAMYVPLSETMISDDCPGPPSSARPAGLFNRGPITGSR